MAGIYHAVFPKRLGIQGQAITTQEEASEAQKATMDEITLMTG